MNKYGEKAKRIKAHLSVHPGDYQSVVSFYIAQSDSIALEIQREQQEQRRKISKYRRQYEK